MARTNARHHAIGRSTAKSTSSLSKAAKLASSPKSKNGPSGPRSAGQGGRKVASAALTTSDINVSSAAADIPGAPIQSPIHASNAGGGNDQPQWPLRVPGGRTIAKTFAKDQYRISENDLSELKHWKQPNVHNSKRPMLLFRERDVERKTLERHGGPEGFLNYLRKLYKTHLTRTSKQAKTTKKPFQQPDYYRVTPAPDPSTYERDYVGRSAKLRDIKAGLAPWLWERCNAALDKIDDDDEAVGGGQFSRWREREEAMSRARGAFANSYPVRPAAPLPSSPAVDALREVLAAAPKLPRRSDQLGGPVEGLELKDIGWPVDTMWYEWGSRYLHRLFAALDALKEAHGMGEQGWATARWEVYETQCECMGTGVWYNRSNMELRWVDSAANWLREADPRYQRVHRRCARHQQCLVDVFVVVH